MKLGIVGAGTIVPRFLEACKFIQRTDTLELRGITGTEVDKEVMKKLQQQYGIENMYTNYEDLLTSDIDVIYIAVPNHLHFEFAQKAIAHHKHVILEKPFTATYNQAKKLIELAHQEKIMIFEAISNQYLPNYLKVKELLPTLGDLKIVELNYSQYSRRYDLFKVGEILPVFDVNKAGGALMDLNVYNIHFLVGLFGAPDNLAYIANIEKGIDTSGILTLSYPTFKCVAIGAKDSSGSSKISIQGDAGTITSFSPANVFAKFNLDLRGEKQQGYALNKQDNQLISELVAFLNMIKYKLWEDVLKANEHTLTVAKILDEARNQIGITLEKEHEKC